MCRRGRENRGEEGAMSMFGLLLMVGVPIVIGIVLVVAYAART